MPNRHLIGLDLLRFAAALLVAAFHLGGASTTIQPFTWYGWVGVQVFFLISGFVIVGSASRSSPSAFARGRFVRLMPTVWLCATFALILLSALRPTDDLLRIYINTLFLWPAGPWIDPVYWTLVVEVIFYVLVFSILALRRESLTLALRVLGLISTAYWVYRIVTVPYPALWLHGDLPKLFLLEHGCLFSLGSQLWMPNRSWKSLTFIGVASLGCLIQTWFWCGLLGYTFWLVPVAIVTASVAVISVAKMVPDSGRLGPAVRLLGLTTYPLYLLHATLGMNLQAALMPHVSPLLAFSIALIAATLASAAVAAWIEPPLQSFTRKVLDRRISKSAAR